MALSSCHSSDINEYLDLSASLIPDCLDEKRVSVSSRDTPLVSGRSQARTPPPPAVSPAYRRKVAGRPSLSTRLRKVADTSRLVAQLVPVARLMAEALHHPGWTSLLITQGSVPRPGEKLARYRQRETSAMIGPREEELDGEMNWKLMEMEMRDKVTKVILVKRIVRRVSLEMMNIPKIQNKKLIPDVSEANQMLVEDGSPAMTRMEAE